MVALHPVQHEHRGGGLAGQAEAVTLRILGAICAAAPEGQQAEARLQTEAPLDDAAAAVAAVVVVESVVQLSFRSFGSVTWWQNRKKELRKG